MARPEGVHRLTLWAGLHRQDGTEVGLGEAPAADPDPCALSNALVVAKLAAALDPPIGEWDRLTIRIYAEASVWADPVVRGEVTP